MQDNEQKFPLIHFDPTEWKPVYKSEEELRKAMDAFSDAVAPDVRAFTRARAQSERLLFMEDFPG
jgi:hypothetical protein